MFAGGVPEFVIKDALTAEIPQQWKYRKDSRGHDKSPKQSAKRDWAVEATI
jgi:hypothetical protein